MSLFHVNGIKGRCYHHHHTMALYISYFMSKNSTLVLVLIVSYSTINKVFIFIFICKFDDYVNEWKLLE